MSWVGYGWILASCLVGAGQPSGVQDSPAKFPGETRGKLVGNLRETCGKPGDGWVDVWICHCDLCLLGSFWPEILGQMAGEVGAGLALKACV